MRIYQDKGVCLYFKMKKAQLGIQESVLAIFIFLIILIISLSFFYKYQSNSIKTDQFDYEKTKFYQLLSIIPNIPELKCSSLLREDECIDSIKLLNFDKKNIFGFKDIKIYTEENATIECNSNNYPNCNLFNLYSRQKKGSIIITKTPTSLYYPLTDEYKFAILEIKWYY